MTDEANIRPSLSWPNAWALAKVLTPDQQPGYVDSDSGRRNKTLPYSPQATPPIGSLCSPDVRRRDVRVTVHSLAAADAAESHEAIAHGDHRSSKVVGRRLTKEIATFAPRPRLSERNCAPNEVLIAHDHRGLQPDDFHVILFVGRPESQSRSGKTCPGRADPFFLICL